MPRRLGRSGGIRAHDGRQGRGRRRRGAADQDCVYVAAFLELQEEVVQLGGGGEGGEAEAGEGGVLEVRAGVREEDEGHGCGVVGGVGGGWAARAERLGGEVGCGSWRVLMSRGDLDLLWEGCGLDAFVGGLSW